jgi:hypothetical protein
VTKSSERLASLAFSLASVPRVRPQKEALEVIDREIARLTQPGEAAVFTIKLRED